MKTFEYTNLVKLFGIFENRTAMLDDLSQDGDMAEPVGPPINHSYENNKYLTLLR
jgi:hypothetical protein